MKVKEVSINLVSVQTDGEDSSSTELFTKGELSCQDGKFLISYEESQATGFQGAVTTLEVYGNEKVIMQRKGSETSNLIIENGKKHFCHYGTPYGDFTMGVSATEIENGLSEDGGHLKFCYVLDINAGYIGDFVIDIDVN